MAGVWGLRPPDPLVCTHAQIQLETRFVGSTCLLTFNLLHFACDSFFSFISRPSSSSLYAFFLSIVPYSLKFWATLFCSSLCERLNLILWISMHVLAVLPNRCPRPCPSRLLAPCCCRVLCLFKCCIIHWFLVAFVVYCATIATVWLHSVWNPGRTMRMSNVHWEKYYTYVCAA